MASSSRLAVRQTQAIESNAEMLEKLAKDIARLEKKVDGLIKAFEAQSTPAETKKK